VPDFETKNLSLLVNSTGRTGGSIEGRHWYLNLLIEFNGLKTIGVRSDSRLVVLKVAPGSSNLQTQRDMKKLKATEHRSLSNYDTGCSVGNKSISSIG
jgi:hypothetical protein